MPLPPGTLRADRAASSPPPLRAVDFARAPFVVIWEVTQACALACLHCRANARPRRDPGELSTAEGAALMDAVRRHFGRPLFILTGGDPLERPDILDLVAHGVRIGLRVAMTPSGTPLMTPEVIHRLHDAGLARLAVSLDGATAGVHDRFRGVRGSFDWSIRMLHAARDCGLSTQVNTTVTRYNLDDFDRLADLMTALGVALWSVFFVVPTGRARPGDIASADDCERIFERMYELSLRVPFDLKSTAAPQYRRVVLQRSAASGSSAASTPGASFGPRGGGGDGVGRAKGVNDGNGFVFISHRGDIFPSGFLPISAGNVRTHDLAAVYRDSTLFRELRDPDRLKGKCGVCEFRGICGGSRARAYAMTGDPLEADPFCAHVPARWREMVERGEAEAVDAYFARRIPGWHDGRVDATPRRVGERPLRRAFDLPATVSTDEPSRT